MLSGLLRPRWNKILRDLWLNKTRSGLVVLAITLGVFSVGSILGGYAILIRELNDNFLATNPASATLWVEGLDEELVAEIKAMPEIDEVEARRRVNGRVQVASGEWKTILLYVMEDYQDIRVDIVTLEERAVQPGLGEILIERSAMPVVGMEIEDEITVRSLSGNEVKMRITGTTHAAGLTPGWMNSTAYGYISAETLETLGEKPGFDQLKFTVAQNKLNKEYIQEVAALVTARVEQSGAAVTQVNIPEPGKHENDGAMRIMMNLMATFGVLTIFLSSILAANLISAMLSQQIRQIGVMKTLGAKDGQIMGIYFAIVLLLSLVALGVGIPIGTWAGRQFAEFATFIFNFDILSDAIPSWVYTIEVATGLIVPLLISIYPVYRGSRVSIREAISDYGVGQGTFGQSRIDLLLGRLRGLGRPLMLSLRNTFRRRERLVLTLATLIMGGAVFMAALNVASAWGMTIDRAFSYQRFNIEIVLGQPYSTDFVEETLEDVSGVVEVEGWAQGKATLVGANGYESNSFNVLAPPNGSELLGYPLVEGRWLEAKDKNALVITPAMLDQAPDLKVGDEVTLNIGGEERTWQVVGWARAIGEAPTVFVNYDYLVSLNGLDGMSNSVRVVTEARDIDGVKVITQAIEEKMSAVDIAVASTLTLATKQKVLEDHIMITLVMLMLLAGLAAIVGGLGLMSSMSMNVIERTREIGIMQAIGASPGSVQKIVIVEGVLIGVVSWLAAIFISTPLGVIIGNTAGEVIMKVPLDFAISPMGMALWLLIVMVFSAAASYYPARRATSLSVNDILAYE